MSKAKTKTSEAPEGGQPKPAVRITKIDILLGLLRRGEGADVTEMSAATGWQVHSVRGAIAGHIKKKLGLVVSTSKADGKTLYRIEV